MHDHSAVVALTLIEATRKGWRLFRNTIAASAWVGKLHSEGKSSEGHVVTLTGASRITAGLGTDTLDLVGYRTLKITPDMVGRNFAQFVIVDAKTEGYKKLSKGQRNFARIVREAGGFAGVAVRVPSPTGGRVAIAEIGEE